jgi:hypothetical protein
MLKNNGENKDSNNLIYTNKESYLLNKKREDV